MFRFFRSIRKSLFQKGKTTTYLGYAFGEILLVVIGILFALQINTWNQNRLDRKKEQDYWVRLAEEIKAENNYHIQVRNQFKNKEKQLERVLGVWRMDAPVILDSVQYINDVLASGRINPWYNEPITWTQLIATGDLQLLRDQDLVDQLFRYYNGMKIAGYNYTQHPMETTNEARRATPGFFIKEPFEKALLGNIYVQHNKVPGQDAFERIWAKKEYLQDLYITLAYICNINYGTMTKIVEDGTEVLKKVEAKQR